MKDSKTGQLKRVSSLYFFPQPSLPELLLFGLSMIYGTTGLTLFLGGAADGEG